MQNLIVSQVTKELEQKTGSKINIGNIAISYLGNLMLEDVFIADNHQDTLIYVKKITTDINGLNLSSTNIRLQHLTLEKPYLKIISYKDGSMNLFSFIDSLSTKNTDTLNNSQSSSFFYIADTEIKDGRFVYLDSDRQPIPFGMNYDDMDFYNINTKISNIRTVGDAIKMQIDEINCEEKSSFKVLEGNTEFMIDHGILRFDNTHFSTTKSNLNAKYLNFAYTPGTKAWANFTKAVIIDYMVAESKIALDEIAVFNDNLLGYDQLLTASGRVIGTVQNMHCEDVDVKVYEDTHFKGNISMNGLPNIDETFFDANIMQLQTSLTDLEKVRLPNYEEGFLTFPNSVKKLGRFNYKGKYTGFISDFVFYGLFESAYGEMKTDISIKPSTRTKQLELSGKIVSNDFRIGELLENDMVNRVSLNVNILNAMADDKNNSFAKIKGTVKKIEILGYPYRNINIDGYFADNIFDGKCNMNDTNIAFDFNGKIDSDDEIPASDFTLHLKKAKLAPLNLNKITEDKNAEISFLMHSHIEGGSIDAATGEIAISQLNYANSKGRIQSDSVLLKLSLEEDIRTVKFKSDFADALFIGDYKISELGRLSDRMLSQYMDLEILEKDSLRQEYGDFALKIKKINPLLHLLTNDYRISSNSQLKAHYDFAKFEVKVQALAGVLKIEDFILQKVNLNTQGDGSLNSKLTIDRAKLPQDITIRWIELQNTLANNEMNSSLKWGDKDIFDYDGLLKFATRFEEDSINQLAIKNTLLPSHFLFDKKEWNIRKTQFDFTNTDFAIRGFQIDTEGESLQFEGVTSTLKDDLFQLQFENFDVGHLWNLLGDNSIAISGKMSGYAKYKTLDDSYTLSSDLKIPNFIVENQHLGSISVVSDWDKMNKALNTKATLSNKNNDIVNITGSYGLESEQLNYTATIDDFDLELINGFTKNYLTALEGEIGGEMEVEGTLKQPKINGVLDLDIPKITIAETGVSYHLNEQLYVDNSDIIFSNFQLQDQSDNTATINGHILAEMSKPNTIDLTINAEHLRILENSYKPLAYGDAHASANLAVKGDFNEVKVKGKVNVDNKSKVIVPFDSASEVSDNEFISFINPADSIYYEDNSEVLFVPTGSTNPATFDIDFNITPSSEIQVFFEAKSGNILKSKGTANLYIQQNKANKQNIIGEYKVEQGTFLYSLQGIVNKKFNLEKGGTISWNGSPEKAYVDLRAVYQLKASVSPLLYQDANNQKLRPTTVLCKTQISGQLEDPKLTFEIEFPSLDATTEGNVKAALQTTDMTKQVLSLLVFNRFTTPEYVPNTTGSANSDALSVTTSELLSSQINNILSQISEDVNVGFIYRPGDDLTKEELGVAVSTGFLQNRVIISGNLGFSSQDQSNRFNDFTGDVDFDIKLNKTGSLRLRAFSHAQDNLYYYENKRNVQGLGVVYSEEFDTFKELIQRYKEKLGWGEKKPKK